MGTMREGEGNAGDAARYHRVKQIVLQALDLQGSAREELIAREAGGDATIADEVRALLAGMEADQTLVVSCRSPGLPPPDPGQDLSGQEASADASREYRLLQRLGAGGMGVVYLAERSHGGFVQKVALKLLNPVAEASPELRERFARERELLARLDHPGIARLLDGGILADGRPFLAMEYVEGVRVDVHAAHLPLDERIALFVRICEAVAEAHRCLVIHRDLKPANILVDARGQPRLLDFGIARLIDEDSAAAGDTRTGQHALTLAYASPEQLACQPLTTATDVYSLGAVLYQLVCGQLPFAEIDNPAGLYNAIANTDVPPPSRRLRDTGTPRPRTRAVPADIDAIVLKALRKEPERRYASVAALAEDLRRYLAHRPVSARAGERGYRARRLLRRNAWPLAAATLVLLSVLGGLLASVLALREARAQQALAERRGQELQRIVDFQRSTLESVDIQAMGRSLAEAQKDMLLKADAASGRKLASPQVLQLVDAAAARGATDLARDALETYVVAHALDRIGNEVDDDAALAAELRQSLAGVLHAIGSNVGAEAQLRRVLEQRQALAADSPERLSTELALAGVLVTLGRPDEAQRLYMQVHAATAARPMSDPQRLEAELGRAIVMIIQGRFDDAIAAYDAIRTGVGGALPESDERMLRLRRYRIDALIQAGRREEAGPEAEALLSLYQRALGATHRDTLYVALVQAKLLREQKQFEQSQVLARSVADVLARRYGEGHPDTVSARYLVATNGFALARDDAALAQVQADIERVVEYRRQQQGEDSAQAVSPMTGLVGVLSKRAALADDPAASAGFMAQALRVQQAVLDSHLQHRGPDHPNTLLAQGSLASLLHRQGRHAQALPHAQRCLEGQRRTLAPDHPIIAGTWNLNGDILLALGRLEPARAAYATALQLRTQKLGAQAPNTIESAARLYALLQRLQRPDEASVLRTRYLDPVVKMDPAHLDAGMRSVRDKARDVIAAAGGR
jgi:serine/threonine-protein kinase